MAKAFLLRRAPGGKFELYLDAAAARRQASPRAGRKLDERGYPKEGLLALVREGQAVNFIEGGKPIRLTKEDAMGFAHKFGRYVLDLGDFVSTYVDEEKASSRDPDRLKGLSVTQLEALDRLLFLPASSTGEWLPASTADVLYRRGLIRPASNIKIIGTKRPAYWLATEKGRREAEGTRRDHAPGCGCPHRTNR